MSPKGNSTKARSTAEMAVVQTMGGRVASEDSSMSAVTGKQGSEIEMGLGWSVVRGGKTVGRAVSVATGELREASSGRPVAVSAEQVLRKVWAVASPAARPVEPLTRPAPQIAFYRKYTEALLERYGQVKLATSRTPSPMTQDILRGSASHTRTSGFDDAVHFCVDVERCLDEMEATEAKLLRRVAIQGYTHAEAAMSVGVNAGGGSFRLYNRALDALTEMLIDRKILDPVLCSRAL